MRSVGRYRIVAEAGRGAMGAVFRALGPDDQPVALKLLRAGATARFQREVQALLRVNHPHLVRLLDAGETQGACYLVMEWVEGETLQELLQREGPLEPRRAAELVRRLALGLAHCHAQGVLHRDLKPANVLVRRADGQPLLTDFGLAREVHEDTTQDRLSRTGQFLGTPGYWAPEQALGQLDQVGPRADVFGLGALLFALLCGRPPFLGQTPGEIVDNLRRPAPPVGSLRPGIPPALEAICARCLALAPAERFGSAAELAQELASWASGARRPGPALAVLGPIALGLCALAGSLVLLAGPTDRPLAVEEPAASLASAAAPADRLSPQEALREARIAWRRFELQRASTLARQAGLDPAQRSEALAIEAEAAWGAGELEVARSRAGQALDCARDDRQRLLAGVVLAAMHDRPEQVRRLLRDQPSARTDADLAFWAAAAAGSRQDVSAWDRVIELDAGFARARYNRSVLRHRAGDPIGAREDLDAALRVAPDMGMALNNRSVLRHQQGDLQGALADARRAVQVEPRNTRAWATLASVLAALGRPADSLSSAEEALRIDPRDAAALLYRAEARLAQGDEAGGMAAWDEALRLVPDDPDLWRERATARARRGDPAGARADYDRALTLRPDHAPTLSARGALRSRQGDRAGALEDLTRAVQLSPDLVEAWIELAALRRAQRDLPGAAEDLERAVQLRPAAIEQWATLAEVRSLLGQPERALRSYDAALALDATRPELWDGRARACLRAGRMEEALAGHARAIELAPREPLYLAHQAATRRTSGDLPGALDDCERALTLEPACWQALLERVLTREKAGDPRGALADAERGLADVPAGDPLRLQFAILAQQLRAAVQRGR